MRQFGQNLRYLFLFCCALLIAILVYFPLPTQGKQHNPSPETVNTGANPVVRVGVYEAPPFAIKSGEDWDGIAVHLWREIARDLNLGYQWREVASDQLVESVASGKVDLGIVAVATANHEQKVDLTHPYYNSKIGIAEQRQRSIWQVIRGIVSLTFLKVIVVLSIIFVVIGILIWRFEYKHNDDFEKSPAKGIWTGFWWAGVTMTTIGYGDKTPKTVPGRILALIWMLVAMGITASLTATIVSSISATSLPKMSLSQTVTNLDLGSISNSPSAKYLKSQDLEFRQFTKPMQGLQGVREDTVDLFVYDAATLEYLNRNSLKRLLSVQKLDQQAASYAFALPEGEVGFETINQQVLQETQEADWQDLLNRYLPEDK
jgi:polar amino acid transport system substrate-binding protein